MNTDPIYSIAVQYVDTVDIHPIGPFHSYEVAQRRARIIAEDSVRFGHTDVLSVFVVVGERIHANHLQHTA
jgi:hypothetical protein